MPSPYIAVGASQLPALLMRLIEKSGLRAGVWVFTIVVIGVEMSAPVQQETRANIEWYT